MEFDLDDEKEEVRIGRIELQQFDLKLLGCDMSFVTEFLRDTVLT
jgi:hypothetical protein